MFLTDVRCDGITRSGTGRGSPCAQLLLRMGPDSVSEFETKCHKCGAVRWWTFPRVMAMSS